MNPGFTQLAVRVGFDSFRYELREDLGPIPFGRRYRAVDITSPWAAESAHQATGVSLELLRPTDDAHWDRLQQGFDLFVSIRHRMLLKLEALGETELPGSQRCAVLITEPWQESLGTVLQRGGGLTDHDLWAVFDTLSLGMFAIHERSRADGDEQFWAHGDLQPEAIVRVGGEWRLAPAHPLRDARNDRPGDLLAAGRLLRSCLGAERPTPREVTAVGEPESPSLLALLGAWWNAPAKGGPSLEAVVNEAFRRLFRLARPSPPATPARANSSDVPAAWQTVLAGCLEPDPAQRWTAARFLFGPTPPAPISELNVEIAGGLSAQLSWTQSTDDEVRLYDTTEADNIPFGEVRGLAGFRPSGTQVPTNGRGRATVPLNGDAIRPVRAVTFLRGWGVVLYGAKVHLSRLPEIRKLEIRPGSDRWLRLTWQWPEEVHLAYVVVRGDRHANTPNDGHRIECLRTHYQANGFFELPVSGHSEASVFVTVFAAQRTAAGLRFAPGASVETRCQTRVPTRLHYRVRPIRGSVEEYELLAQPNRSVTLPEMLLVAASTLPLRREEGFVLLRLDAGGSYSPTSPLVRTFRLQQPNRLCGRLFCVSDADYDWLELVSEPASGVSIG